MTPRRRDVLGLLAGGTAALAGCSELRDAIGDSEPTVEPATIEALTAGDVPSPAPVVAIDADERLVDTHRERVAALLREVPTPLTADHVPNAAIRQELSDAVEHAHEREAAASSADHRDERFRALRDARGSAGFAAWAWRAIDGDTTLADVETAAAELRDDLAAAERDREYVGGDDVVRAVLAHDAIESRLDDAGRRLDRGHRRPGTGAVAVGEAGSELAESRANLDGATVRYDAYTASLDGATSERHRLASAVETLRERVRAQQPTLPDDWDGEANSLVGPDIEELPAGWALEDLAHSVEEPERRFRGETRLASSVLEAHDYLAAASAFETLRDRIERGDHRTLTSAEDVRTLRGDAVDAIRTALGTTPGERLTRRKLVRYAGFVAYVDRELREDVSHSDDPVPVAHLDDGLGYYLGVAVLAGATPDASAQVVAALRE